MVFISRKDIQNLPRKNVADNTPSTAFSNEDDNAQLKSLKGSSTSTLGRPNLNEIQFNPDVFDSHPNPINLLFVQGTAIKYFLILRWC